MNLFDRNPKLRIHFDYETTRIRILGIACIQVRVIGGYHAEREVTDVRNLFQGNPSKVSGYRIYLGITRV
jgi:hypothetical protein